MVGSGLRLSQNDSSITEGYYRIFLYNEWTYTGLSFQCIPVNSQEQVLDNDYSAIMIKLPNGTFIHDFVVSRPGTIIIRTAKGIRIVHHWKLYYYN